MGSIERMEDLVRRYCSRRYAQGNARTLAEDIRMSSLEALLRDDLEKHVQMNRARLNSSNHLREETKTYCDYRGHASVRTKLKGPSHPGGDDTMDLGAFGKGKGKQNKGKHGKGKGRGKQGQQGQGLQGQQGQGRHGRDKNKGSMECWNCGKRGHLSKDCWSKNDNKGIKENTRRSRRTLTILTRRNPREETMNPKLKLVDFTCVPSM